MMAFPTNNTYGKDTKMTAKMNEMMAEKIDEQKIQQLNEQDIEKVAGGANDEGPDRPDLYPDWYDRRPWDEIDISDDDKVEM